MYFYEHKLANLISSANDARNITDIDVLVSLSNDLEKGVDLFIYAAHKHIDARGNAGYPHAKVELSLNYHDLFQNQLSAMRLLQNRHDHLSEVKAHKCALDESRQDLSNPIDDAY